MKVIFSCDLGKIVLAIRICLNTGSFSPQAEEVSRFKGWDSLISSARNWLKIVKKDWIKANHQVWSIVVPFV